MPGAGFKYLQISFVSTFWSLIEISYIIQKIIYIGQLLRTKLSLLTWREGGPSKLPDLKWGTLIHLIPYREGKQIIFEFESSNQMTYLFGSEVIGFYCCCLFSNYQILWLATLLNAKSSTSTHKACCWLWSVLDMRMQYKIWKIYHAAWTFYLVFLSK